MGVTEVISDFENLAQSRRLTMDNLWARIKRLAMPTTVIATVAVVVAMLTGNFESVMLAGFIAFVLLVPAAVNEEHMRACRDFARRHGLRWARASGASSLQDQGVIFGIGHSPMVRNSFISTRAGQHFGVFTYKFTTGRGNNLRSHYYTVAYYDLAKELPHILLDSSGNDGLLHSSVPRFLSDEYKVSLEGDFDTYFTLYTAYPKPAEALTIISPDVMQTLMRETPEADIEIINQRLWVYLPGRKGLTGYAQALRAGWHVLNSAKNNLKNYRMDAPGLMSAPLEGRGKLYLHPLTWVFIGLLVSLTFLLIYLHYTI